MSSGKGGKPKNPKDEEEEEEEKIMPYNDKLLEIVVYNIENGNKMATAKGKALSVKEVGDEFADANSALVTKARAFLLGATPEMVYYEFVAHLAAARISKDYTSIVSCGVFAVSVAYSTSESWVREYDLLKKPHLFQSSEIESREAVKATSAKKAITWVTTSNMNAHFVRIFGNMIVCSVGGSGFLHKLGERAGTFLNPPPETDLKERSVLMRAALKEMQESDINVIKEFKNDFGKYADVVSYMFGAAGGDIEKAQTAIKAMDITYI